MQLNEIGKELEPTLTRLCVYVCMHVWKLYAAMTSADCR